MVYLGFFPKLGTIKLVDYGEYAVCVDSDGHAGAFGYCAAQKVFRDMGLVIDSKGTEYGKDFEIWRYDPARGHC